MKVKPITWSHFRNHIGGYIEDKRVIIIEEPLHRNFRFTILGIDAGKHSFDNLDLAKAYSVELLTDFINSITTE